MIQISKALFATNNNTASVIKHDTLHIQQPPTLHPTLHKAEVDQKLPESPS